MVSSQLSAVSSQLSVVSSQLLVVIIAGHSLLTTNH